MTDSIKDKHDIFIALKAKIELMTWSDEDFDKVRFEYLNSAKIFAEAIVSMEKQFANLGYDNVVEAVVDLNTRLKAFEKTRK